jgi:plasmid stabilization system protein ParE
LKRTVRLSPYAGEDISRLVEFLADKNPPAAKRARGVLVTAFDTLAEFPERGARRVMDGVEMRELHVKFGRFGYVLHYRVGDEVVLVVRIFHILEHRG